MSTLAERCRQQRKKLKLTQQQLATACGLSQVSIAWIEAGITQRPRNILQLATALKCNPFWLLFGESDDQEEKTQ